MQEKLNLKQNTQERRFIPATESLANERLAIFRNRIKEFQKKHPEVLGATIFGSMIRKDKADKDSDVDAIMYIDIEKLMDIGVVDPDDHKKQENIAFSYMSKFERELKIPEEELIYYHMMPVSISRDIVEDMLEDMIYRKDQYLEWKKNFDEQHKQLSEKEKETLMTEASYPGEAITDLSSLFHARVGSGIEKYRHIFLEKLYHLNDKETAEYVWKNVSLKILRFEQGRDHSEVANLPKTLKDAIRVYHPDLYKEINN